MSNREIAAAVYLSCAHRRGESHRIYRKLDVRSPNSPAASPPLPPAPPERSPPRCGSTFATARRCITHGQALLVRRGTIAGVPTTSVAAGSVPSNAWWHALCTRSIRRPPGACVRGSSWCWPCCWRSRSTCHRCAPVVTASPARRRPSRPGRCRSPRPRRLPRAPPRALRFRRRRQSRCHRPRRCHLHLPRSLPRRRCRPPSRRRRPRRARVTTTTAPPSASVRRLAPGGQP